MRHSVDTKYLYKTYLGWVGTQVPLSQGIVLSLSTQQLGRHENAAFMRDSQCTTLLAILSGPLCARSLLIFAIAQHLGIVD